MNFRMLKAMKAKQKRPVDPNAPPRPNLMTHNVKIRTMEEVVQGMETQLKLAQARIDDLERKMRSQTTYIQALHNRVTRG